METRLIIAQEEFASFDKRKEKEEREEKDYEEEDKKKDDRGKGARRGAMAHQH